MAGSSKLLLTLSLVIVVVFAGILLFILFLPGGGGVADGSRDDLVFIHHSVGANWLASGLDEALLAKPYVDERNDIYYGTVLSPDEGRPHSLGDVPGDLTDMDHWILWFNDYLEGIKAYHHYSSRIDRTLDRVGLAPETGTFNRIVMVKSCYPNSHVTGDGDAPGDPFSAERSLTNYQAIFRHPAGPGHTYTRDGYSYLPLEEIFAANPDVLFIFVTPPPLHYAPADATDDSSAGRARSFNDWLANDWLPAYSSANPDHNNVAVFDLFDVLATADDDSEHPNRLQAVYGGDTGDSHPNRAGNEAATNLFAAGASSFLDEVWLRFSASNVQ
jgi:hypothetical protein